jgi:hypothetical protein
VHPRSSGICNRVGSSAPRTDRTHSLQEKLRESEANFETFIEESRALESDARRADELRNANTILETNLARTKQQILRLEAEIKTVRIKLQNGIDTFKSAQNAIPTFPVIQNNGHVVDFHRIVSKWAKTAEEDETTATRSFMCPIENAYTSLAQPRIIDQIQRVSMALGLKADPPLLFESKTNDTWTQLSNKHHIQLTATVCYLYANHRTAHSADVTVNKELFSFTVTAVRPIYFHIQKRISC